MSRIILFKGKRIGNGEWIEGYVLHDIALNEIDICRIYELGKSTINSNGFYSGIRAHEETVCQFTGLLDSVENNIYEGDKATCKFGDFTVKFIDGCFFACFTDHIAPLYAWNKECKIIGNIHD